MPIQQYDDELSSIPTGLSHFVDWFADVLEIRMHLSWNSEVTE